MNWSDTKPSWVLWVEAEDSLDDVIASKRKFSDLMKTDDAAAYLGIHRSTVNRLVNRGKLVAAVKPVEKGKWRWFRKADLNSYKQGRVI